MKMVTTNQSARIARNWLLPAILLILTLITAQMIWSNKALAQTTRLTQKLNLGLSSSSAKLRSSITVNSKLVTLGDLFENAGTAANKAVFRSPSIGSSGTIKAYRVVRAAKAAGLTRIDTNHVDIVRVSRASQKVTESEVIEALTARLRMKGYISNSDRVEVELSRSLPDQHASYAAEQPFDLRGIRFDRSSGQFAAILTISGRPDLEQIRLSGIARETVLVPVTTRQLQKGDIVSRNDVTIAQVPKRQAQYANPAKIEDIIGKQARQMITAGSIAGASAFVEPNVIERSDVVTIMFKSGSLTLSMRGKALSAGINDDIISVQNTQTSRIIRGRIMAPGLVIVGEKNRQIAALEAKTGAKQ